MGAGEDLERDEPEPEADEQHHDDESHDARSSVRDPPVDRHTDCRGPALRSRSAPPLEAPRAPALPGCGPGPQGPAPVCEIRAAVIETHRLPLLAALAVRLDGGSGDSPADEEPVDALDDAVTCGAGGLTSGTSVT
jgi:hypothetical protein